MTVHVPEDLKQFVHQQVRTGRYPSEDDVVRAALEQLRERAPACVPGLGSIGAMHDDAELLDEIVEHAMKIRSGGTGSVSEPVSRASGFMNRW